MPQRQKKSLMRSLGEFVGHIVHGVKSDPNKKQVRKTVEEEQRGNVTLRRTTIEEIEYKHPSRDEDAER